MGGHGGNIEYVIEKIDELKNILSSVNGQDLPKDKASEIIAEISKFRGLGISTWSKLLYFFNASVESKKCQIYDLKIVDSLK